MSKTIQQALRELVEYHEENRVANLKLAPLCNSEKEKWGHRIAAAVRAGVIFELQKVIKGYPELIKPSENLPVWFAKGVTYRANNPDKNGLPFLNNEEFFKYDPDGRYHEWVRGWDWANDILFVAKDDLGTEDPVIVEAVVKSAWDKVKAHNGRKGKPA